MNNDRHVVNTNQKNSLSLEMEYILSSSYKEYSKEDSEENNRHQQSQSQVFKEEKDQLDTVMQSTALGVSDNNKVIANTDQKIPLFLGMEYILSGSFKKCSKEDSEKKENSTRQQVWISKEQRERFYDIRSTIASCGWKDGMKLRDFPFNKLAEKWNLPSATLSNWVEEIKRRFQDKRECQLAFLYTLIIQKLYKMDTVDSKLPTENDKSFHTYLNDRLRINLKGGERYLYDGLKGIFGYEIPLNPINGNHLLIVNILKESGLIYRKYAEALRDKIVRSIGKGDYKKVAGCEDLSKEIETNNWIPRSFLPADDVDEEINFDDIANDIKGIAKAWGEYLDNPDDEKFKKTLNDKFDINDDIKDRIKSTLIGELTLPEVILNEEGGLSLRLPRYGNYDMSWKHVTWSFNILLNILQYTYQKKRKRWVLHDERGNMVNADVCIEIGNCTDCDYYPDSTRCSESDRLRLKQQALSFLKQHLFFFPYGNNVPAKQLSQGKEYRIVTNPLVWKEGFKCFDICKDNIEEISENAFNDYGIIGNRVVVKDGNREVEVWKVQENTDLSIAFYEERAVSFVPGKRCFRFKPDPFYIKTQNERYDYVKINGNKVETNGDAVKLWEYYYNECKDIRITIEFYRANKCIEVCSFDRLPEDFKVTPDLDELRFLGDGRLEYCFESSVLKDNKQTIYLEEGTDILKGKIEFKNGDELPVAQKIKRKGAYFDINNNKYYLKHVSKNNRLERIDLDDFQDGGWLVISKERKVEVDVMFATDKQKAYQTPVNNNPLLYGDIQRICGNAISNIKTVKVLFKNPNDEIKAPLYSSSENPLQVIGNLTSKKLTICHNISQSRKLRKDKGEYFSCVLLLDLENLTKKPLLIYNQVDNMPDGIAWAEIVDDVKVSIEHKEDNSKNQFQEEIVIDYYESTKIISSSPYVLFTGEITKNGIFIRTSKNYYLIRDAGKDAGDSDVGKQFLRLGRYEKEGNYLSNGTYYDDSDSLERSFNSPPEEHKENLRKIIDAIVEIDDKLKLGRYLFPVYSRDIPSGYIFRAAWYWLPIIDKNDQRKNMVKNYWSYELFRYEEIKEYTRTVDENYPENENNYEDIHDGGDPIPNSIIELMRNGNHNRISEIKERLKQRLLKEVSTSWRRSLSFLKAGNVDRINKRKFINEVLNEIANDLHKWRCGRKKDRIRDVFTNRLKDNLFYLYDRHKYAYYYVVYEAAKLALTDVDTRQYLKAK